MTQRTCGYVDCTHEAVAQTRQLVGKGQVLPVCQAHKDALLQAWANIPPALAHLPVAQVMEPLMPPYSVRKALRERTLAVGRGRRRAS